MTEMQIESIKTADLVPYENNPRLNDDAVEYVANSIREFGFKVPIIIDQNNVIIAGHTRLKAAERLGLDEVPCIRAEDLNEDQVKAFRLADNKVGEIATWDLEKLSLELEDIELDMSDFGFEMELDDLELDSGEITEDEIPDPPKEPKAKYGDVYRLGNHILMCGDATKKEDVEMLMSFGDGGGSGIVDIAFTSPPYGASNITKIRDHYEQGKVSDKRFYNMHEDDINDWWRLMNLSLDNMIQFSKSQFVNVQMLADNKRLLFEWVNEYADYLCDVIIWNKSVAPPQMQSNILNNKFEFIFCFDGENNSRTIRFGDFHGNISNVIDDVAKEQNQYVDIHRAVFPIGLALKILQINSKAKTVMDLFGGTGTTLIACEQLNRHCRMMELDPKYIDVIIQRWENLTGEKAELIDEIK